MGYRNLSKHSVRYFQGIFVLLLMVTTGYGQSNLPNPLVNLALTEDATLSANAPENGRGIITDILYAVIPRFIAGIVNAASPGL